jgi:arylsulfatase A-like enzyme
LAPPASLLPFQSQPNERPETLAMSKTPVGDDFHGVIKQSVADSTPWWPPARYRQGAPNVVMVVLDDTGFAHLGCYGSTLATPNIDALAAGGVRFTGFHTTALCSPTRACLLTGRNHHAVGMRAISNFDTGFPNMRGAIPRTSATLAEILRENGYATFAAGKWHLAPMGECSAAGPFTNWPLQKGFDRYYGFLQGETDQFFPELTSDNHFVDPPGGPADGYHVSEDIVDRSADMIRNLTSLVPERPFFLYLAFGAMHSPHQAPQAYLEKWRGRFDAGWDVAREAWFQRQKSLGVIPPATRLAPRNPGVKPWTELGENEQRFACRLQEAFAAFLEHTDDQIGRLVAFLKSIDRFDDTIFVLLSDNGASQEGGQTGVLDEMKWFNGIRENPDEAVKRLDDIGGPDSHCNIPWGWAQAGNTPLKWYKQNTHGGGVRDPLIVHWAAGLKAKGGETRQVFCHAIDVAPTILDLAGLEPPETVAGVAQMPMHGVSLAPAIAEPGAAPTRSVQYFEMLGRRGLWKDGWKAVTRHTPGQPFESDRWELYHLAEDFSEYEDLAEREPERLKALIALWNEEAERHSVFPLDDRNAMQLFRASGRPGLPTSRTRFVYYPPISHLVSDACPPGARGWAMTAEIDHPHGGDGALIARGSLNSGFALYVKQGRLVFDYNHFHDHTRVAAAEPLAAGPRAVQVSVERTPDGGGDIKVMVDGSLAAAGRAPKLLFVISSTGMDIGRSLSPVTRDYAAPFVYPGRISRVVFEVPESRPRGETRAEARAEMARQ